MAKKEDKALSGAAGGASTGAAFGPWGALIGGVAGGAMGLMQGDDDDGSEQLAKNQALWAALKAPSAEDLSVDLDNYRYAGDIQAKEDQAQQLGAADALQNVQLDPRLKAAQMSSLDTLSKIAGGGFTPDEKAAMDSARQQREADVTSKLKALQQSQDMRGVGNSDMALSQRMLEAQSAANRGANDARAQEGNAFARSLSAISQRGTLAGQMDNTDYNRQAALATNLNNRELTNMQQRANVNNSNVNRFNNALQYNNTNQQANLNNNTNKQHTEATYNSGAKDRAYTGQVQRLAGMTGANINMGQAQNAAMRQDQARTAQVFNGITNAAAALRAGQQSDSNPEVDAKLNADQKKWGY